MHYTDTHTHTQTHTLRTMVTHTHSGSALPVPSLIHALPAAQSENPLPPFSSNSLFQFQGASLAKHSVLKAKAINQKGELLQEGKL